MPEEFEITGTVSAVEQKRYRDGGGLIPGFWSVKLQTAEGERSCSFNSERRKDPQDRNSAREPHPDFSLIQRAQVSGERVRIRGHLTRKGDGENARTFKNGTAAELVDTAVKKTADDVSPAAVEPNMGDAKWAIETVLPTVDAESPMSEKDLDRVKQEAGRLLDATKEVAEGTDDVVSTTSDPSDLERRRQQRKEREGIA